MSWSVQAMGRGAAVGRVLKEQLAGIANMAEPEQSMKDKVAEIVDLATAAAPDSGFVVRAAGHQCSVPGAVPSMQSMHLKVEIDLMNLAE